jgi:hypothetical protein
MQLGLKRGAFFFFFLQTITLLNFHGRSNEKFPNHSHEINAQMVNNWPHMT